MASSYIPVDEGLRLIRKNVDLVAPLTVRVGDALGRVTAATHYANRTVPSFPAAAMDGFAIASGALRQITNGAPVRIPIAFRVAAGSWPQPLPVGSASAISTGAPVPEGADCVIMVEHASVSDDGLSILIRGPMLPGLNIRQVAEDAAKGQLIVGSGHLVTPDLIAGFAAYGITDIHVFRTPRAATVVTGSELLDVGRAGVQDCIGPMITAYLSSMNAGNDQFGPVEDEAAALDRALDSACDTDADVIITTGGASHGEQDLVRGAIERRHGRVIFHGLSMRPGKPVLFAILPDGRPFFGLPGNPVSACLGMRFFVSQAFRAMLGLPDEQGRPALSEEKGREDVTSFLRGRFRHTPDCRSSVDTTGDQRSHVLSSLIAADAWLRVDRVNGSPRHVAFPKDIAL